uniref:Uncharacterized protein n=1 Tax=Anguilla anguilla TaxID=7936 RepID=A0A0E9R1M0_ANGAN
MGCVQCGCRFLFLLSTNMRGST